MSKTPRWTHECDDTAVLAQAILSGVVTDNKESFNKFFDPDCGGGGASIGEKYQFHSVKGKRNLRLNCLKLYQKIKLWESNKPDPVTGKRKCTLSKYIVD